MINLTEVGAYKSKSDGKWYAVIRYDDANGRGQRQSWGPHEFIADAVREALVKRHQLEADAEEVTRAYLRTVTSDPRIPNDIYQRIVYGEK